LTLTVSLAALVMAFDRRLRGDSTFTGLVGLDAAMSVRLYHGWPDALLAKPTNTELPRVTYFVPSRRRRSNIPEGVTIQTDAWEWAQRATGGQTIVDGIDDAMLLSLSDGDWGPVQFYDATDDVWVQCRPLDASDPPGEKLRRRSRDWEVTPC